MVGLESECDLDVRAGGKLTRLKLGGGRCSHSRHREVAKARSRTTHQSDLHHLGYGEPQRSGRSLSTDLSIKSGAPQCLQLRRMPAAEVPVQAANRGAHLLDGSSEQHLERPLGFESH